MSLINDSLIKETSFTSSFVFQRLMFLMDKSWLLYIFLLFLTLRNFFDVLTKQNFEHFYLILMFVCLSKI
jgi:hypothetical protein